MGQAFEMVTVMTTSPMPEARAKASCKAANIAASSPTTYAHRPRLGLQSVIAQCLLRRHHRGGQAFLAQRVDSDLRTEGHAVGFLPLTRLPAACAHAPM
jgi:hypothetical protein